MKITVIGSCSALPKKNEAASSYLIQSKGINILLDCGSGSISVLQNYINLNEIDAIILSHFHADHMSDIYCLQYGAAIDFNMGFRKNPLQVYAHKLDSKFQNLKYKNYCIAKEIDDKSTLKFHDLKITFKWMKHTLPCLGTRIQEGNKIFSYSGDTEMCNNLGLLCKNADIFLCESTLLNEQSGIIKGHLSCGEAGKIAKSSKVKKLILTHISKYTDINKLKKQAKDEFCGSVIIAEKGLVLEL